VGLLRQWLAGYEDVYDAERLRRDPATRAGQAEGVIQLATLWANNPASEVIMLPRN
jgi:hypothetical protein